MREGGILPADSFPKTKVSGGAADVWAGGAEASAFFAVARNAFSEGLVGDIVFLLPEISAKFYHGSGGIVAVDIYLPSQDAVQVYM